MGNQGLEGGLRLINTLCPVGKAFYRIHWARCRRRKKDFAYGFYERRRREQAILVHNCTAWKLRRLARVNPGRAKRYSYARILRDVSNAFPSVEHGSLNRAVEEVAPTQKEARILKHRHERSEMVIRTKSGEGVVLKPGTGGLQGDVFMPPLFGETCSTDGNALLTSLSILA
jgi:hypothetical protein